MEPFLLEPETSLLRIREWESFCPGLIAGFTTRNGGSSQPPFKSMNCGLHVGDEESHVINNRKRLTQVLDTSFDTWISADQVHGNRIAMVGVGDRGRGSTSQVDAIPHTDGLLTDKKDIFLTSFYADCVPLFFVVPDRQIIGMAHAGWKGTAANIAGEMVMTIAKQFQLSTSQIHAAIGPSIGSCCYEVDEKVIAKISSVIKSNSPSNYYTEKGNHKYQIDLKKANQILLNEAGIPAEQILSSNWCTSCRSDLFFSYRKEAGKTGRMAAFMGWHKE